MGTLTPLAKMFGELYVDDMEAVLPKVTEVVVMGGAVDVPGNLFSKPTNLKAEFNIYNVCFCNTEMCNVPPNKRDCFHEVPALGCAV